MFEIFGPAYIYVDGQLSSFLGTGLGNIIAAVRGPLLLALTLYIVLYGYAIFRGSIAEPVMDGVVRLVKLCFIFTVATTVAYNDYVTQPLLRTSRTGLPAQSAAAQSRLSATRSTGSWRGVSILRPASRTPPRSSIPAPMSQQGSSLSRPSSSQALASGS